MTELRARRNGQDRGRSVSAKGLWCDVLCSPYHSFGTLCEDAAYHAQANREFKFTAVDVSERNVLAALHELQAGAAYGGAGADAPHRAAAARGPTDVEVCALVVVIAACTRVRGLAELWHGGCHARRLARTRL